MLRPTLRPRIFLATFASLLLCQGALAQEGAPAAKPRPARPAAGVCHDDVQRLCAEAKGKPGGVMSCLQEHRKELSPNCREQFDKQHARMQQEAKRVQDKCSDEIQKYCSEVASGGGARLRCLMQHRSDLSPGCQGVLPHPRMGGPRR